MNQRNHDGNFTNLTLSRAGFVRTLTLGAVGATVLAATGKARADEPSGSLSGFVVSMLNLLSSKPDMPGTVDVMAFMNSAYPTGLSADDALLLRGALYLKADRLIQGIVTLGIDPVTDVLSRPLEANPLSPLFFKAILDETKERAASDPQYADSVVAAGKLADQVTGQPGIPEPAACLFPIIFGIILVVLIVVVLLEK